MLSNLKKRRQQFINSLAKSITWHPKQNVLNKGVQVQLGISEKQPQRPVDQEARAPEDAELMINYSTIQGINVSGVIRR